MFETIIFHIPVTPVAKARPRFTKRGHCYTLKKTSDFEEILKLFWKKHGYKMIPSLPTKVHIMCFLKRPKVQKTTHPITRPDLDNYAKGILDALNGHAWKDDSQVTSLLIEKRYIGSVDEPRIWISIKADA